MQCSRKIVTTNMQHPTFYRTEAFPLHQRTVSKSKHWTVSHHIPWTCLPHDHLESSIIVLITTGSWLPCGKLPKLLISPLTMVPINKNNNNININNNGVRVSIRFYPACFQRLVFTSPILCEQTNYQLLL